MLITVGIITLNESKAIDGLLNDLLAQDYDKKQIELIFADGLSQDDTKEKLLTFATQNKEKFFDIKIFDNNKIIQAAGWNVVITNSMGEAIIRVDAHANIPRDFVRMNVEVLNSGEDVCGGRIIKVASTNDLNAKLLLMAENSIFGSSPAKYRRSDKKEYVKSVAQACYKKEVFEKVGLFDEGLLRSEDTDMHYRIREAGYKILMSDMIHSEYYARNTLGRMCKQKYLTGKSIGIASIVKNIKMFSLHHFVPYLFLLSLIFTAVLFGIGLGISKYQAMIYPFIVLIGLYVLVCFIFAIKSSIEYREPLGVLVLPFLFFLLHFSYAIGTFIGFIDFAGMLKYKKNNIKNKKQ